MIVHEINKTRNWQYKKDRINVTKRLDLRDKKDEKKRI